MMSRRSFNALFIGAVALGISGCSSSSMVQSWKDPTWTGGPLKKVLIIGVAASDNYRRVFEDRFRTELQTQGITGVSSYSLLPGANLAKADIEAKISETGVDGVVVSRIIDRKTVETIYPATSTYMGGSPYYPSYYGGYYNYYNTSYSVYTSPGYTETTDYVYVETNVYSAADGKLIWTGVSETAMTPGRADELIGGVIETFMGELQKERNSKK